MTRQAEREFLERSLADLDEEHAAGDLADEDFARLRASYERRLARLDTAAGRRAPAADRRAPGGGGRSGAVVLGVVVVAIVAGVALAGAVGRRGAGDNVSGIDLSEDEPTATVTTLPAALGTCRALPATDALDCFLDYTQAHPDDARGFSELGLFLIEQFFQSERQELLDSGTSFLQRALEIDPGLVVARANLAVVLERTGQPDAAREVLAPLLEADDLPADIQQLVDFVQGNLAAATTSTTAAP